ncbi:hypothetical protein F5Y13DRAFT_176265 [Hypoxylon sp. FL1857]|nr:hypothetical protein F5Y13DRAFT_176265 [Hypoxylon sp. FL1857]
MEAKGYTRLDRGNVLPTLESRLSASQSSIHGPQVQLFRINYQPSAVPSVKMPHLATSEEPRNEEPPKDTGAMRPPEDLIQTYTKRIQVMQAIINQLREAGQERKRQEDDAKKTREELAKAKLRIAALEDELERVVDERNTTVEQGDTADIDEDEHRKTLGENEQKCTELEISPESLSQQHVHLDGRGYTGNDVISIHHAVWGSESVHNESLNQRLLDCATQGSSFIATCDFVGRATGPGERRTLVIAYSKTPDGSMRWLVLDEGQEGKFDLQ